MIQTRNYSRVATVNLGRGINNTVSPKRLIIRTRYSRDCGIVCGQRGSGRAAAVGGRARPCTDIVVI